MAQTTYNLSPAIGVPGQVEDLSNAVIESYPCSEAINFGVMVEVVSGAVRPMQTAATSGKKVGLAVFDPAREQAIGGGSGQYAANEMVPVMRRGRAFARWTGTTQTEFAVPNIRHASTNGNSEAQYRGMFTDAATSATAGSEIQAGPSPGAILVRDTGSTSFCLVELDLVGAS